MSATVLSLLDIGGGARTPLIMQTEAAECGLACLTMVARHHGHDVAIAGLRSRHAISAKGSGLAQLIALAGHLQLAARPVRAEPAALARLACRARLRRG